MSTPDPHAGSERETLRCPNPHCENGVIRGTSVGCAVCSTGVPTTTAPLLPASEYDLAKLDRLIFDYHDAEGDETGELLAAFTAVADFARTLLFSRDGMMRSLVEHQQKELRALLAAPSPSEERRALSMLDYDGPRCEVCGWTLSASREEGCVPGDCSYRPAEGSAEWHRIKARRAPLVQPEPQPEEQG